MSVFFTSEPAPHDPQLAELWELLENETFREAVRLAESVCQDANAPIEFFCGLSLASGELGYYADAERIARGAIRFGEGHWRARHALSVALMHQGRFMAALDSLGFYHTPDEIYLARAQVEKMGRYTDSLRITLEDALLKDVPPAIFLYLAYLYGSLAEHIADWPGRSAGVTEVRRFGGYLEVWERDAARHRGTPYGEQVGQHVAAMRRLLSETR